MLSLKCGFVPLNGDPEYSLFESRRFSDRNRSSPHLPLIDAIFLLLWVGFQLEQLAFHLVE